MIRSGTNPTSEGCDAPTRAAVSGFPVAVLVLTLGALGALAPALAAQTRAVRMALVAWDDSLQAMDSGTRLATVAGRATAGPKSERDLRLADFQLRQATLTHDAALAQRALIRLDAVAAAHRDWAMPEVLVARAFFGLSDEMAPMKLAAGLHEGESYVDAAWRHLRYAMAIDPADAVARRLALRVLVPEGDRALRGDERVVLHALESTDHVEWQVWLVAARDGRVRVQYDSALALFDRALAAGGDRSVIQPERAPTLSALGDTTAAADAYWDGLDHLTPAGREAYRYDLAWILPPDSLTAYDAVATDSLADWMQRFWALRDAAGADEPGARLQEQFRRWNYAFAHYRVAAPWRHTQFTRVELGYDGFDECVNSDAALYELLSQEQPAHPGDVRHREPLLDNRGLMYLHHGPPYRLVYGPGHPFDSDTTLGTQLTPGIPTDTTLLTLNDPGLECARMAKDSLLEVGPNEAWLYWIDGAWRVLNFRGSCALGRYAATTLTSYLPISRATIGDYLARANLTPDYYAAAMRLADYQGFQPATCLDELQKIVQVSRADADLATRSDSHTPYIPRPWNAVVQAFALGADQSGEALVTFAIPIDSLQPSTTSGAPVYLVHARLVGFDRRSGRRFTIDTVRRITAPATRPGPRSYLSGWFEFALDPGDWTLGVRMNQGVDSIGTYALQPHLLIAAGDSVSLSDIVTGASNGLAWPAPDGREFPVNVLGAWTAGGTADIYYELRGLAAGASYQTVVELRESDARAKPLVRLESTDQATGATTAVRKSLGLSEVKAGDYQLVVTITAAGRTVSRTQRILVVKAK